MKNKPHDDRITSDNINIIRDDIFKNYKINLQNPTRISQDEFLDFDKLKNDASFAKWYSGINPKTGRKISINGKVHNEIKQMHQFKSYDYYKSIDDGTYDDGYHWDDIHGDCIDDCIDNDCIDNDCIDNDNCIDNDCIDNYYSSRDYNELEDYYTSKNFGTDDFVIYDLDTEIDSEPFSQHMDLSKNIPTKPSIYDDIDTSDFVSSDVVK
jgi:hypothetical protein